MKDKKWRVSTIGTSQSEDVEKELNFLDRRGYDIHHMNAYTTASGQPMIIIIGRLRIDDNDSSVEPENISPLDIHVPRPLSSPISRAMDEVSKNEAS